MSQLPWLGFAGYGLAAVAFGGVAVMLLVDHAWHNRRATVLMALAIASALWSAVTAAALLGSGSTIPLMVALDALYLLSWTACLTLLLTSGAAGHWQVAASTAAAALVITWSVLGSDLLSEQSVFALLVVMALLGGLAVEGGLRGSRDNERRRLVPLSVAALGIFAVDLFIYGQATLYGGAGAFWYLRGFAGAAVVPLLVLTIRRQVEGGGEFAISRQAVFGLASVLGIGGYVLITGVVAHLLGALAGSWSVALERTLMVVAAAPLVLALSSPRLRGRLKVFLVKHLFRSKYDYREEWLRLTQILGLAADLPQLSSNALAGLAGIIGARRADLYVSRDSQRYDWAASLDGHSPRTKSYLREHPVVTFLASQAWVIDTAEYAHEPERYNTSFGLPGDDVLPSDSIIVPLDCQGYLQGFVVLARAAGMPQLNFDDHDILKTAGRQVAVVLAQGLAQEKLAETRQFEATSKLTTFLMHDLKNVVAQQELVLANAERFGHRREFIDDAFTTIRSGVERMRRLIGQLTGSVPVRVSSSGRAEVTKIVLEVRARCADRNPVPDIVPLGSPVWVGMDRERLASVLTHVIRNAQDATPADGRIGIVLERTDRDVVISVTDTGSGMDETFVRDRLFRPFDTTKGVWGMGVGVFQVRDTLRAVGGDVEVSSQLGAGTVFRLRIPSCEARDTLRQDAVV